VISTASGVLLSPPRQQLELERTLDFELAGDTGFEVGEATLTISSGTAVVKFVVVWKKVDGQWRLHRDIWNAKGA
jgi:ketosteroid isomerase-like protein